MQYLGKECSGTVALPCVFGGSFKSSKGNTYVRLRTPFMSDTLVARIDAGIFPSLPSVGDAVTAHLHMVNPQFAGAKSKYPVQWFCDGLV